MSHPASDGDSMWPPVPNYPADAFAGTARYYARYRAPYPQELIDDLRARAKITYNPFLFIVGCLNVPIRKGGCQ